MKNSSPFPPYGQDRQEHGFTGLIRNSVDPDCIRLTHHRTTGFPEIVSEAFERGRVR